MRPSSFQAASMGPTMSGIVKPPKLLPMVVSPITRPCFPRNQMETSRPAGSVVDPENARYWKKLRAYQCHSWDMKGLKRKLPPMMSNAPTMSGLAPRLSMNLPRNGAVRAPTATKDSDALMAVRCHPNASSSGPMNSPKA